MMNKIFADYPVQGKLNRPCKILAYDGNKYALCAFGNHIEEIKAGYLYALGDESSYIEEILKKFEFPWKEYCEMRENLL